MTQHKNLNNIFLTGATGHLGTELVSQLLAMGSSRIFVLMRGTTAAEAAERLCALWADIPTVAEAVGQKIVPVIGDITKSDLALSDEDIKMLRTHDITHIVHCAAETGLKKSREELWSINVVGTENVVDVAMKIAPAKCRFVYVSTAYVAGQKSGIVTEEQPLSDRFFSLYEESKAAAERLVRHSSLPWIILRPGMIVGHSVTGYTRNFNTIYYVLKLLLQGKMHVLPVSRRQTVNIIPVDFVASMAVQLMVNEDAIGRTFHLTQSYEQLPTVGELLDATLQWAEANLQVRIRRPHCIPIPFLETLGGTLNIKGSQHRGVHSNLLSLMPYFCDKHIFDRTSTNTFTAPSEGDWKDWLPAMLTFACRHNFMQLTSRSIFEQAMVRRESRRFPITYYNIRAQGISEVSGHEMNDLIRQIVGVLHSLHIHPSERVAVTGINCTEQAAIDCAIGLVGAVSVPIYYTTPADEAADLIARSGSSLFFVGDKRMMNGLATITLDVPIITFANAPQTANTHSLESLIRKVQSSTERAAIAAPIARSWNGVSTIRYTSGTTGDPKGVMFSFQQLKWMGEVLTNLLPWHDRNTEMRYLSFLPMSHVVEGILAAYAPYCMLCRVKFYYLNDFAMLTKALPQVCPTVFFSVPRFYEKLWEQIEHNPLGRRYLTMSNGPIRRTIGTILRKAVLRKAGLNRCSQLIVGSAPMSEEFLLKFRALGIEIHNAYGQTEAPLITINRLGDNSIPSIGTPLPDTTVTVAEDGELIVRGPQVAMGYYHLSSETFRDGALHTGDLGEIDAEQHVFIRGRKKDMLITSYGKNINCSKIEQRLTDIDGITHAVLIGEQRPYCCALLWTENDTTDLQAKIDRMNATLSHPEQIKKWRIVERPLSISGGELTPNLKVRRNVVWENFRKEADDFYN